jgi:hypothetical protein
VLSGVSINVRTKIVYHLSGIQKITNCTPDMRIADYRINALLCVVDLGGAATLALPQNSILSGCASSRYCFCIARKRYVMSTASKKVERDREYIHLI